MTEKQKSTGKTHFYACMLITFVQYAISVFLVNVDKIIQYYRRKHSFLWSLAQRIDKNQWNGCEK